MYTLAKVMPVKSRTSRRHGDESQRSSLEGCWVVAGNTDWSMTG